LAHGISVKPTIRFSKGVPPTLCIWGGARGSCWGLFLAHRLHFHILSYLCWRAWGRKNAGPRWSWELSILSEFLHGTAWQMWQLETLEL
jgi:hypothetical protein